MTVSRINRMDAAAAARSTGRMVNVHIAPSATAGPGRSIRTAPIQASNLVLVQRDWNGWRKALTPLSALEDVHWRRPAGAPRPLVHAYVRCSDLMSGEVPHECHGDTTHRLLVCVLRQHTLPSVFSELVTRAGVRARC